MRAETCSLGDAFGSFCLPDGRRKGPSTLRGELQLSQRGSIFAFVLLSEREGKSQSPGASR